MNILIDIRLLGKVGFSGIEEYTRNLVTALLETDQENNYEFFYNGLRKLPLTKNWLNRESIKIHSWNWPNKIFDISSRIFHYPKIDKHLKPDLIFSPHFNILSLLPRTKRIVTVHDISFMHHPYFFSLKHKFWHSLQNIKHELKRANLIVTDSDFVKNDLINTLGLREEKIKRIYPGISPRFFLKNEETIIKEKNKPYILCLGTLEPRKNILTAIRAFEIIQRKNEFKDFNLVIAGPRGWVYKNILRAVKLSPYREKIRLTGQISMDDKIQLYRRASLFLYPSFFEGFGFPPLEAQASGVPVIATNRTSLPEVLGSSALLIDPWRIGDWAHAIELVLGDEKFRQHLIGLGTLNVKRFSWEKTARELIQVFDGV